MKLSGVREAACIRASTLLNQANPKKGVKSVQPEIASMSEIFGIEFDKHIYKSLFDEIEFKDVKALLANKNSSSKLQYFIQEFPTLLDRPDFTNIFSHILFSTQNPSTATEIFEGLLKLIKLSYESQFKIIYSFFISKNEKYLEEIKNIFSQKSQEFHKENKNDQLTAFTVQNMVHIVISTEDFKNDIFFSNTFTSYLTNTQGQFIGQNSYFNNTEESTKQITDIENLLENTATADEPIEFEKALHDLGPFIITNNINITRSELMDCKLDEKRLANFIIFLCKHQTWVEDKENRNLNKVFLRTINVDPGMNIEDSNEKKINVTWNIENYYKMFKNLIDSLDVNLIFNYFDDPLFSIKDKKTFEYFISVLQKLKFANFQNSLYGLIFKKWNNEINQIEFLNFLINQPDCFSFKNYNGRKVKKTFELSITVNKNSVNHLIEAWSCIDLIEVLLKLSKGNYYIKIKEMFEWAITNVPELLVIGLAIIKADGDDFLYEEIINDLLPLFLGNHINSIAVLEEVWNLNKDLVIKTICNMYRNSPDLMNLSRILDITQKLKESLIPIVSCSDHNFTVNLAILAVKRDFLHIDQWLAERISKVGDDFIESLLNYIKENVITQCKDVTSQSVKENILEKCQLSLESLAIIFENLTPNKIGKNPKVSKRIEGEITNTYKAIFEIFDELQVQPPNSEEIEEAANKLYQNLFQGELTVEEVIEKMKAYKNSSSQKESEIYACLIHSLLDEYRFFHQYPERELTVIATLFGQIINQKLLDGIIETIALKYVIEGIKKGNGNMYLFATIALDQFTEKLQSSPQYLQSLISIPSLKNSPGLYEKINEKFNEMTLKAKKLEEGLNMNRDKSSGQVHGNYIDFNPDEKKQGDKMNVKMPGFNKGEFNNVFYGMSGNQQHGAFNNNMMNQQGGQNLTGFNNIGNKSGVKQNSDFQQQGTQNPSFFSSDVNSGNMFNMGGMYFPLSKQIYNL